LSKGRPVEGAPEAGRPGPLPGAGRTHTAGGEGESFPKVSVPQELVQAVEEAGERLTKDPTPQTLEDYRRAVKRLIERVLEEAARVRSELGLSGSGHLFTTVAKVNERLLELADEVLRREREVVRIAHITEEIKGLIIDLVK